jgi:hypothetical protein
MPIPTTYKRKATTALLWVVVVFCTWIIAMQLAVIAFAAQGEWQSPDFYQVEVVEVFRDSGNAFTRDVQVTIDGQLEVITLPKKEAAPLRPHDLFWVVDNLYSTPLRPAQFRLTFIRVLTEYPEILLLLAILGLAFLRRSKWDLAPEAPPVPEGERKVYRDTFHHRAQRHKEAAPEDPEGSTTASTMDRSE